MRKHLTLTLALAAALVVGISAIAFAAGEKPTVVEAGNVVLTINGKVTPKALPKHKLAPIALHIEGGIATKDGSQPPALREVIVDTDKHGTINAKGVPACRAGQIEATDTTHAKAACKKAIVGEGKTTVRVAFPEQTPFNAVGPLVVFNGGVKGGVTTLYIHAYVAVPTPTAIVTTVKISKEHKGLYGTHSIASIPLIAGGSGSVTHFELTINHKKYRNYLEAECANGKFVAQAESVFRDGTRIKGGVVRTCKAKG
jgi:hypothetical protein